MFTWIVVQIVLIALNAIFACAEIAVLSINNTKIEKMAEDGNKQAKRLSELTKEPAKFLSTIQVAITLSGFLASAFAADNFAKPLVNWLIGLGVSIPAETLDKIAVVIITLILSYFTLVFGELVPKRVAMKRPEILSLRFSGLLSGISVIFKPVVWLLSVSTNAVLRLIGIDPNEEEDQVSEEEIRMMADAGSEDGTIDKQENEFIQNVFEFDDLSAEEIATHRTEVDIIWTEDEPEVWAETIHGSRHTLYPVCEDSADNVIGILNAKDYFRLEDKTKENILALVRPAYFVPDTIKADVLFLNMKKAGNKMAIVLDEYGGMVGIITLNDLIEKLVGDLGEDTPEEEAAEPHIEQIDDSTWRVVGNVELTDIEQALDVEISAEDIDTFTGLVFNELGVVPSDGKQDIEVLYKNLGIRVTAIEDHQISEATIHKIPEPETDPEE